MTCGPNNKSAHMVIKAYEGVMMNEWNGIMDGWGSFLNDRTIFISFHLSSKSVACAHNDEDYAQ